MSACNTTKERYSCALTALSAFAKDVQIKRVVLALKKLRLVKRLRWQKLLAQVRLPMRGPLLLPPSRLRKVVISLLRRLGRRPSLPQSTNWTGVDRTTRSSAARTLSGRLRAEAERVL